MLIRKAVIADIKPLHKILAHFGDKNLLLPRSLNELYTHLRDYFVVESEDQPGEVHGVCGLRICWENLAEIKSLAVKEPYQQKGCGRLLVEACLTEAERLGLRRVFALTYVPEFFHRMGFSEVEKSTLPHKVWADCLNCPKFPDCDEHAVSISLAGLLKPFCPRPRGLDSLKKRL
jgi:amino-acid N-acetyltransferase